MKMVRLVASAPVVVFVSCASPASATIVDVVYAGTVANGYDLTGVFGGGDLAGELYVAEFVFDTSLAVHGAVGAHTWVSGGPGQGGPPNFAEAVITIGGVSATIPLSAYEFGELSGENFGNFSEQYAFVQDFTMTASLTSAPTPKIISTTRAQRCRQQSTSHSHTLLALPTNPMGSFTLSPTTLQVGRTFKMHTPTRTSLA